MLQVLENVLSKCKIGFFKFYKLILNQIGKSDDDGDDDDQEDFDGVCGIGLN